MSSSRAGRTPAEAGVQSHGARRPWLWVPAFAGTRSCAGNAQERGFTLIEVMVALAVFGLAALALVRLQTASVRGTAAARDAVLAQTVARNVAIDAVTAVPAPALGDAGGVERNGGTAWRWTRSVRATGNAAVLRVDVSVLDRAGRPTATMTMVRPPDVVATVS